MKNFLASISRFFSMTSLHNKDEAYLNESIDIYDLERRQRQLDTRQRTTDWMVKPFAR